MVRLLDYLVEHRHRLKWIMLAILGVLVVLDVLIPSAYDRFPWESIGGFGAVYGFVACALIILIAKGLGLALLYRDEDYYDD